MGSGRGVLFVVTVVFDGSYWSAYTVGFSRVGEMFVREGYCCRPGVVSLQKQRGAGLIVKGVAVNSACNSAEGRASL